MKVAIATNSVDKINGIVLAFSRFFSIEETEVEVFNCAIDSGVPSQPFDEDTYKGALNRVNGIINSFDADFYVACEAGIDSFMDIFFSVQVVCIYEKNSNKYFFGKSAGWQIPTEAIATIKETDLDKYLRSRGYTCLEDVLGKGFSRANDITEATMRALSSRTI